MASLGSLPVELWQQIAERLTIFDLEAIARTFNREFYRVAMSTLTPQDVAWMHNARRMSAIFPQGDCTLPTFPGRIPAYPSAMGPFWNVIPPKMYKELGLDQRGGPYRRASPPDLRWAQLDGSFAWMEPAAEDRGQAMEERWWEAHPVVVNMVEVDARWRNLHLPQGFGRVFRDPHMQRQFDSRRGWHLTLKDALTEYGNDLPAPTRGIADGYGGHVVRFHRNPHTWHAAYLYLLPSGGECVIYSLFDLTCDHPFPLGTWAVCIQAFSFEEYLFQLYYEEQLGTPSKSPRSQALKDYVQHVYKPYKPTKAERRVALAEWKKNRKRVALVPEDL